MIENPFSLHIERCLVEFRYYLKIASAHIMFCKIIEDKVNLSGAVQHFCTLEGTKQISKAKGNLKLSYVIGIH